MSMQYDRQVKTRVYTRSSSPVNERAAEASPYDGLIGMTQPIARKKGLFDGISVAQVVAGAAAAATSMLLASRIGIAGSVIGAAVSSVVTVVCSQLYRNALDASAEKLKLKQLQQSRPAVEASYEARPATGQNDAAPATVRRGARIAPTKLQARAASERAASKRKVALVSLGIAAAAVALCAGIVLLGTAGEGLGERPQPLFAPAAETASDAQESTEPTDADGNAPAEDGDAPTDANSTGSSADSGASDTTAPDSNTDNGADAGDSQDAPSSSGESSSGSGATGDGANSGATGATGVSGNTSNAATDAATA